MRNHGTRKQQLNTNSTGQYHKIARRTSAAGNEEQIDDYYTNSRNTVFSHRKRATEMPRNGVELLRQKSAINCLNSQQGFSRCVP
jgi:hypothetical protein